jgi:hypothetical protein
VPIGSASVGQVHVARLPGGQEVVVKVQRPGASDTLNADIDLLYRLARLAKDRVKRLSFIDLEGLVDEFARTVRQELDYRNEARNDEAVRRNFEGNEHVRVPRIHWRQSTGRVLTQDRLHGPTLAHADLEVMIDDRYFTPLSFDATFEESVKVRAEAVTRTVQKKPAVTASIVTARAPETARPVLESATRVTAPRPQQKVAAQEADFIAEVDGRKITADDLRSLLRSTRR